MSDPANTHSDGFLAFGSQILTFGGVAFIADEFSLEQPSNVLTRRNEFGVPVAETLIEDVPTGSVTLQLPSANAALPTIGATTTGKNTAGADVPLKVSKVGQKFTAQGETKIMVDLRKRFATGGA